MLTPSNASTFVAALNVRHPNDLILFPHCNNTATPDTDLILIIDTAQ